MKTKFVFSHLGALLEHAHALTLTDQDRFVVFSDLHVGNGGKQDDFKKNAELFRNILKHYYLSEDFHLILNGDIEELQKFRRKRILQRWPVLFDLFGEFHKREKFFKLIGNHDFNLIYSRDYRFRDRFFPALKFDYHGDQIFVFHGHQASGFLEKYNTLIGFLLRYIAKPFGIRNYSTAYNSRKKFKVEKKAHDFARDKRLMALIGHTHRPLFESLSKIDVLKFKIEQLVRDYTRAEGAAREAIARDIQNYKNELLHHYEVHQGLISNASLYESSLIIPCLFNSGCGIGKRGITALELAGGRISLIYWYDEDKPKPYHRHYDAPPVRLQKSPYFRMVLESESLDYIFSRIKLLAY